MKIKMMVLLFIVTALLIAGCGKGKGEQKAEATADTAQVTQSAPQMELPKVELPKLEKAIESLSEFGALVEKLRAMPEPKDQAEAQKRTNDMVAKVDELAKKCGLANAEEYGTYISVILQIALGEQEIKKAEQMSAQLPEDQKAQMQAQLQYMKSQFDLMKTTYGDEIFKLVASKKAKIDAFVALQEKIQAEQMQAQMKAQQQAQQAQTQGTPPAQKTR